MIKKIMIFILSILIYSIAFGDGGATTWKFNPPGAKNNLMIVYKVLPFASFSIEKPENMRVAANTSTSFTYSGSTKSGKPLMVTSNVQFRDEIVENTLNTDIAKSLYAYVTYSFENEGKIDLKQEDVPQGQTAVIIPGQAYFTDQSGNGNETIKEKKCNFNGNLVSGALAAEPAYIDVKFSPDEAIPMGTYRGTLTVVATYEGKDLQPTN